MAAERSESYIGINHSLADAWFGLVQRRNEFKPIDRISNTIQDGRTVKFSAIGLKNLEKLRPLLDLRVNKAVSKGTNIYAEGVVDKSDPVSLAEWLSADTLAQNVEIIPPGGAHFIFSLLCSYQWVPVEKRRQREYIFYRKQGEIDLNCLVLDTGITDDKVSGGMTFDEEVHRIQGVLSKPARSGCLFLGL